MNILVPDSWLREFLQTDAKPEDIFKYLSLCGPSIERVIKEDKETIYDIEITSNRIDCAGVYGIAREANAILPRFGFSSNLKHLSHEKLIGRKILPLEVLDKDRLCQRVLAVVMDGVTTRSSCETVRKRLEYSGVRSLNNIIDITNYIMLETGHPVHVFDYDRIKTSKLVIRNAKKGEKTVTLDGKEHHLNEDDVVIDDGTGRIIDLPGIMGTENSVVTDTTKRIVLFIESNNSAKIRKTSMRLGIRTIAASINEKGPDPVTAETAFLRAISMYEKEGVSIAGKPIDIYPKPPEEQSIDFDFKYINEKMGISLDSTDIQEILSSLGFKILSQTPSNMNVVAPHFRMNDIKAKEDILEEIARVYGYFKLPSQLMEGKIPLKDTPKIFKIQDEVKDLLKYTGCNETYSYSFISKSLIEKSGLDPRTHIRVSNPLTKELEYMRISLIPSLLAVFGENYNFKSRLSLFELSKVYIKKSSGLPDELLRLSIVSNLEFHRLKGLTESIFDTSGIEIIQSKETDKKFFHPGKTVSFINEGKIIATAGMIDPLTARSYNIGENISIADIDFEMLAGFYRGKIKYSPIPPYPPVIEELTLILPNDKNYAETEKLIYETDSTITKVRFISAYENNISVELTYTGKENLDSNRVSKIRSTLAKNLLRTDIKIKGMTA